MAEIENVVCNVYDIKQGELASKNRERRITDARKAFFYMVKKLNPDFSLQKIGKYLSKHHATVIHSIRQCENLLIFDKPFHDKIQKCTSYIDTLEYGNISKASQYSESLKTIGYYYK